MATPIKNQKRQSILTGIRNLANRILGYQAVVSSPRRSRTFLQPSLKSEDAILGTADRAKLISLCRDLVRNFSIVAWAVRQHCTYVSSFTPAVRNVDQQLKADISRRLSAWQLPQNFDVTKRRSLQEFLFQAEWLRVVDGDVLLVSYDGQSSVMVEADRIKNFQEVSDKYDAQITDGTITYVEGVLLDRLGAPLGYSIGSRRQNSSGLDFEMIVPAQHAYHLAYFTRYDQVRGISPLASAGATFQDIFESIDYEITKHKIAQLFGIKIVHENSPLFGVPPEDETDEEYPIDFGRGPYVIDLRPGDDIQVVESAHPSATSSDFYKQLISLALKSLDLPYSFFDESAANYSSSRLAWLQYLASCGQKRQAIANFLQWITTRWLKSSVENGDLPEEAYSAEITWVPIGQPWIDPLKEVQADVMALHNGLVSRQEICRRHGRDYETVLEELLEDPFFNLSLINQMARTAKDDGE